MINGPGIAGVEVARFPIGDSKRETAVIDFSGDEAFVRVTPEEEGPGFHLFWTTEHSAAGFAQDVVAVMRDVRVPMLYGGIQSGSSQRQHLLWCNTSQEFMQRIPKINPDIVQGFSLYTGCANVHWHRYPPEGAVDVGHLAARYLASLEVSSDTVRRERDYNRAPGLGKQSGIRDIILKCIEATGTEAIKEHSETALMTLGSDVPLLRAA